MSFLLTLLLLGFIGLAVLAFSPFIIIGLGKSYVKKLTNPYEKAIQSFQKLEHPSKRFLHDVTHSYLLTDWINRKVISTPTLGILLTFIDNSKRVSLMKSLPKEILIELNDFFKSTKRAKPQMLDACVSEIHNLLKEDIKSSKASRESYQFYYYEELYEHITFIESQLYHCNHVIRHQINDIMKRTLLLLPRFEEYNLFEFSHKFKTLIQKDLKESLRLLSEVNVSQKSDREADLYTVLKGILHEIDEIEQQLSSNTEDELTKKMRVLKEKFNVKLEGE